MFICEFVNNLTHRFVSFRLLHVLHVLRFGGINDLTILNKYMFKPLDTIHYYEDTYMVTRSKQDIITSVNM